MNKILIGTSLIVFTLLSSCTSSPANNTLTKPIIGMANPASIYCEQIGGSSITKQDISGNEVGYCKRSDGTIIDEWQLYRSAHQENQKNLIISYDVPKKQNVLKVIEAQKIQIIYALKNINIIVVSIPQSATQESTKQLKKIDGVLDVQEDSKMELH
ncbi:MULTISPECIES: DUF333 domain-containing protein [unclassified Acinetobacter]|uniref:putative hemolysin n=1 Tax=unclassified Acinetobacter TaxID=196816 RepID=UPI002934C63D|nr:MULTISPECIES: DUF333 domain-containing protein [unclassified Acinetobacter]WOE32256.1 DUF333 domain-containing protein [Acinetobacter sp. SAAs470]WOE37726.1 DUF333 domain-containing protein [Acinetobacter sp. SAAs474]